MIGEDVQVLRYSVPGRPVGKQRPRATKRGVVYTPPETRKYEQHALQCARGALANSDLALSWPMRGIYHVTLAIYCGPGAMPDGDNVHKSIVDAAIGVLWEDDCQVGGTFLPPQRGADPRVDVTVAAMATVRPLDQTLAVQVRSLCGMLLGTKPGTHQEARARANLQLVLAAIGGGA